MSFKKKMCKTTHKNVENRHKMLQSLYKLSIFKPKCLWYNVTEQVVYTEKGADGMYSAMDIARYIISECNDRNIRISNLKLQKLLYFAWIDFYKATKTSLFNENICAWEFGPVVPEVYRKYCAYGGRTIWCSATERMRNIDENVSVCINKIVCGKATQDPFVLVNETHIKDMPWDIIYKNGIGDKEVIPFTLIASMCDRSIL